MIAKGTMSHQLTAEQKTRFDHEWQQSVNGGEYPSERFEKYMAEEIDRAVLEERERIRKYVQTCQAISSKNEISFSVIYRIITPTQKEKAE